MHKAMSVNIIVLELWINFWHFGFETIYWSDGGINFMEKVGIKHNPILDTVEQVRHAPSEMPDEIFNLL